MNILNNNHASELIRVFCSTCSKKTSLKMKCIESNYRSALTDESLQSILIGNTNFELQLNKLLSPKEESPHSH